MLSNTKDNKTLNEVNEQKEKLTEKYISQLKKLIIISAVNEEIKLFWATNYSKNAIKQKTIKLAYETLKNVSLLPEHANRFASELSGGQRQRVGIARAIIMNPLLLIADEPISALDVSIQAQVINILKDLRSTQNLSILLIAHDLRMVNYLCDRIAVINEGRIVEIGKFDNIYHSPIHPYIKSLMSAIPSIDNVGKDIIPLEYIPLRYEFDAIDLPQIRKIDDEDHFVYGTNQQIQAWKKKGRNKMQINKEKSNLWKKINNKFFISWFLMFVLVTSVIIILSISLCKSKVNKFENEIQVSVKDHIKDNGIEIEYKEKENILFCKRGPIVFKSISKVLNKHTKSHELLKI